MLTPALPERMEEFLPDALKSVQWQTYPAAAHLIGVDYEGAGTGVVLNRLLAAVQTPYVTVLADDDWFRPNHLAVAAKTIHASHTMLDLVHTDVSCPNNTHYERMVNKPVDWDKIETHPQIGAMEVLRTDAVHDAGGWGEGAHEEDWSLYKRMAKEHPEIWYAYVPTITKVYRIHGSNKSGIPNRRESHPHHR